MCAHWPAAITTGLPAEPALDRNAYGVAYRVDEIRVIGGGVVPVQAAVALLYLLKIFLDEQGGTGT